MLVTRTAARHVPTWHIDVGVASLAYIGAAFGDVQPVAQGPRHPNAYHQAHLRSCGIEMTRRAVGH